MWQLIPPAPEDGADIFYLDSEHSTLMKQLADIVRLYKYPSTCERRPLICFTREH